ncbi:hypothetical protein SCUCBS95973_008528 [Sporothrix curviconia]|uniref:Mid2 domain-containing protein n=1 Tax=Sporothrix curviconia TaxID=1260050 RepID=A0ABP0CQ65_9PEZI
MYSQRLVQLLFVALSFMAAAQALKLDADLIRIADNAAVRRADESVAESSGAAQPTGNDAQASSSAPSAQATSTPATTTSSTPSPTTSNTTPTTSTTPPADTTTPTTTSTTSTKDKPTTSSTTSTTSPTTDSPTDSTTKAPGTTTSTTQPVSTSTFLTTITQSDGSTTAVETETTTTPTGSLSSSQSGSKTSGMSTQTRNIIIGVVVGVGGAIILVVIGLVALRIRRRNQAAQDGNGLNDYDPNFGNTPVGPLEKTEGGVPAAGSASSRTPFQSTLESYHTPTQVNTASNF